MQVGDILHGFRLKYTQQLPEVEAVLYRMEYEKNGADLVWLHRPDDNKTFAIAFKTIPQDDTGVFHILEHSVLCGSKHYPVKEPFVELLKSSLQTFLNAFTFPDKTMYPVCSRNDKDFLNLIDVYMDAVLHPLSIEDPHAFRQEGWHYELEDPEGELICNGVVYNEMKGAYASADSVLESELARLLFPDNCYGFESGGHPDHIPELTYQRYLASHREFYHPSNARIFLDGDLDLDAVLGKLDSFLGAYDRLEVHAEIPMQAPVCPPEGTASYEIGPEEDGENKVILAGGWVFGDYSELEKNLACSVLTEVLAGSNEAPLKKAILEAGLAEELELSNLDGIQQQYAILVARNTSLEKKELLWDTVEQVLRQQIAGGVDRNRLEAVLNHLEFTTREKDFGSMPRGLVYAMSSMESWLYGGDPAQDLSYEEVFRSLREKLKTGWYEQFLQNVFLDNPHRARLTLLPSKTLGDEKREKERARLQAVKASWSREETLRVMEEFQLLRQRQGEGNTPEQLATLPRLSLRDIPEAIRPLHSRRQTIDQITVLHQDISTDGISYLDLYFDLRDMELKELPLVTFFTRLLGQVATEHYDVNTLRSELEGKLGRLTASSSVSAPQNQNLEAIPTAVVSLALLEHQKADGVRLLREVLLESRFTDTRYIYNLLRQSRLELEQGITMSGNAYGRLRVAAGFSALGAVGEQTRGLTFLRWLQDWEDRFETDGEAFCRALAELPARVFSRRRLTVSLTGPGDDALIRQVVSVLPDTPMGEKAVYKPFPVPRLGVLIPADICFAVKGGVLSRAGTEYSAAGVLSAQILTYGFLWNTIRVQGGAYGTGLSVQLSGDVSFSSYRDPNGSESLGRYDEAGAALRAVADSGESLESYIISTIGAMDPLMTPRMEGRRAAAMYFAERTDAQRQAFRHDLLHMQPEALREFSRVLDQICADSGVCVIGGKQALDACGDLLETVEPLQKS